MTIREIAKLAGVSSAAVSRYFNNGYLSKDKRAAIKKVVDETGYRPSLQAQTLRTKKTRMIGVIIPKIDSSAIGSILTGILSQTNKNGYQILLAVTENNPAKELEYLTVFDDKRVDAVIFAATVLTSSHKKALKKMDIPVVIVGQKLSGFHCVYHDDYQAEYELTSNIIQKGRKRIGYLGATRKDKAVGEERYQGFCQASADADMPELAGNSVISGFSIEAAYEKAGELFSQCPELDALICATDKMAIGAMRFLKETGKRIPQDVMVAGHGDSTLSLVCEPMLTTIHYYYEDSGAAAAKMVFDILDRDDATIRELKLGYRLIARASTEEQAE